VSEVRHRVWLISNLPEGNQPFLISPAVFNSWWGRSDCWKGDKVVPKQRALDLLVEIYQYVVPEKVELWFQETRNGLTDPAKSQHHVFEFSLPHHNLYARLSEQYRIMITGGESCQPGNYLSWHPVWHEIRVRFAHRKSHSSRAA